MGQDIATSQFTPHDFHRFERRLVSEMALLHEFFRNNRFSSSPVRIGLELEAWLVDDAGLPQPRNVEFLQLLDSPSVVPELSRFNVEFNVAHQSLSGNGLRLLEQELTESWRSAQGAAASLGLQLATIGILPTIDVSHLCQATMTPSSRFQALNEQVLRLRRGRPITLQIDGPEPLDMQHHDVMLEAAATSLQVHLQVPIEQSVRYYNAATIASAIVVGVAANSPLLFGKSLWAESRLPLFEQAVDIGGPFPRVHLGYGYVLESLEELFLENRACHPVLLPMGLPDPVELLPHVRLHNGTIWRWNRPLIGFDERGEPHLRIEHRVMPAGPTLIDMMANIAFASGLIAYLAQLPDPPELTFPYKKSLDNFLSAARGGLSAEVLWLDGSRTGIRDLVSDQLLKAAATGLASLKLSPVESARYLDLISARMETGQNGAVWQQEYLRRHGPDRQGLMRAYLERQQAGIPVHEWDF